VESAPFFIPSTSFCSLSWFASSCTYHIIHYTVTIFALTIYHSLSISLQTKSSSIVFLVPFEFRLPSRILDLDRTYYALEFVCFSFFLLIYFLFWLRVLDLADHTQQFSPRFTILYRIVIVARASWRLSKQCLAVVNVKVQS